MINRNNALSSIPDGLRKPLLAEFDLIVKCFAERRWTAAELSAGKFCEVVFTILDGYPNRKFAASPSKPRDMVNACRKLESNNGVPRSFRILIPRLLPALYEVRNNRNVGHVGGDVNPDFMDSAFLLSAASWILSELVRVFHDVSTNEAQEIVDNLAERRMPLVWTSGELRRVLDPSLDLKSQVLILLASSSGRVSVERLLKWTGYENKSYFTRMLRNMHRGRQIEFDEVDAAVELLPPGAELADALVVKHSVSS